MGIFKKKINNFIVYAGIVVLSCLPLCMGQNERNPIFSADEELEYDVYWMGIRAGTIKMKIDRTENADGTPIFRGVVIGETSSTFSTFFVVKDVITSLFATDDFRTFLFAKNIHEGKYRKIKETTYDHTQGIGMVKKKNFTITPGSKDPISSIYFLRDQYLSEGSDVQLYANADEKEFLVTVRVSGREEIKTPAGVFQAITLTPLPTWEGRVFEEGRSEVKLWLSDDIYKVPLKITMKVKIGSLKAILAERKGPGWGFERQVGS